MVGQNIGANSIRQETWPARVAIHVAMKLGLTPTRYHWPPPRWTVRPSDLARSEVERCVGRRKLAGRVFISYRRSESAWAARALFERLWREFPQRVFIDLESIALGVDFTQTIDEHLEGCEAMLAVIGPTWLDELNDRLKHDETDFVRIEVARALVKNIPVVPVLLDRVPMPRPRELPEDLRALTRRNGLPIMADTFDAQMGRVVQEVRRVLKPAAAVTAGVVVSPVPAIPDPRALPPEPWMSDTGIDECGRWAEFRIRQVVQRLRWIEPGEFWMGSTDAERTRFGAQLPKDQKGRFDDEGPRHRVTLSLGFWMADTACTQGLWQEVMGDNPSHFTGDLNLPVEQVNWQEVMSRFVPELARLLGSDGWGLPTEAQWEFACRAGTETAYHFGESIRTDQTNFDGDQPAPGSAKGLCREKTVPVKALPANAWGLVQMHGNVWEWCRDAPRRYSTASVRDPDGGDAGTARVLRGGSWHVNAKYLRAACRLPPPQPPRRPQQQRRLPVVSFIPHWINCPPGS
ncbi:MAG: SUMF1/EgtB/PvdO family nonheme iron enzyme [Rubrivivax sp.]